ncbi:hypothetical protein T1E_1449 [Pseudomonas putida DOT-T1E]|uniref:Uncharacterized protein n=1 Tax=Pseudomonas putida (strain DOT-T1E) TaxID=1196325 RepID=I7C6I1_PSEPT|nr:hypothetical protein T1E_1449 [Pseudomonas putida DOT-T1E]
MGAKHLDDTTNGESNPGLNQPILLRDHANHYQDCGKYGLQYSPSLTALYYWHDTYFLSTSAPKVVDPYISAVAENGEPHA